MLAIFLVSGFAGCALAVQLEIDPLFSNGVPVVIGANGAALGLLTAWYVDDRRPNRGGHVPGHRRWRGRGGGGWDPRAHAPAFHQAVEHAG